jgi:lysophospholipase L1-like esterase
MLFNFLRGICAASALIVSTSTLADQPWTFGNNTKFLALGDSLTTGIGATPETNSYVYLLYQQGVYDSMTNTSLADIAMPGATSEQVLHFQVPMAIGTGFLTNQPNHPPQIITMTVGGNDFLTILPLIASGVDPQVAVNTVLVSYQANLTAILAQICTLSNTRIYIANAYYVQNFPQIIPNQPPVSPIIDTFNLITASVVQNAHAQGCAVKVADVHSAFAGPQQGLLVINRPSAGTVDVHPTNAGYVAIEQAFIAAK